MFWCPWWCTLGNSFSFYRASQSGDSSPSVWNVLIVISSFPPLLCLEPLDNPLVRHWASWHWSHMFLFSSRCLWGTFPFHYLPTFLSTFSNVVAPVFCFLIIPFYDILFHGYNIFSDLSKEMIVFVFLFFFFCSLHLSFCFECFCLIACTDLSLLFWRLPSTTW